MMTRLDSTLGIHYEEDVEIPMRDGVILRGNLWRPQGGGSCPGLVMRTPYGKSKGGFDRFVRAGYAVLCQDTRGRYASDGTFTVFSTQTRDPEDGYDTVEWMAAQPWCNGRIGSMGASYVGWTQWMTAKMQPPHLLAMCARSIPLELTDVDWWGSFRPGRRLHWWFTTIAPDLRRRAGWPPPHTPAEARRVWQEIEHGRWIHTLPYLDLAGFLPPPLDTQVRDWLLHPERACWNFAESHGEIAVPNLDFTGWYDHCNSLGHLTGMQRNARTETARTQTKVVVGPWAHGTIGKRECMGLDFGPQAAVDVRDLEIRWFDHWLKGIDNGVTDDPPVRYFEMGSQLWKSAPTWPPPNTDTMALYLSGDGAETVADDGGGLRPSPQAEDTSSTYRYDPRDPVPTLWTPRLMSGATDRSRLNYRRDILRYRTPVLDADVSVAGNPEVVLFISSTAPDTDFFVWLSDEQPDGRAIEVCYGMVRARYRHGIDRQEPLPAGQPVECHITLGPTACRFLAGHRIRVDISSSDFPNFDRNHNTGKNDLLDTELRVAYQRIFQGTTRPSRLLLPMD